MKKLFVLYLSLVPLSLLSNPRPAFIIDEFQVSPDSLERIELYFGEKGPVKTKDVFYPLVGWTVTTIAGTAIIDSVAADGDYAVLGHSNLHPPFSLNDFQDVIILKDGYGSSEGVPCIPYSSVEHMWCDTVLTPPPNTSISLWKQVIGFNHSIPEPIVYEDWYIDSTPTFGFPNNDYPGGCKISGSVFSKDSTPMRGIVLYAQNKYDFPTDTFTNGMQIDTFYYFYTTISDSNGNYLFDSVVCQQYKISVISPMYTADTVYAFAHSVFPVESLNIYLNQSAIQENSHATLNSFLIYPTPVRKNGNIEFSISKPAFVEVSIYNISGSLINKLLTENKSPGKYKLKWDTRDENNAIVPKGVYFCRLKTWNTNFTKKLILL